MATAAAAPGAGIPLKTVPNLRDIGGWPTRTGGRVRRGLLFRSTELDKLQGDDLDAFAKLGVRSVYDLRTAAERTAQPDRVPAGTRVIVVDVLADAAGAAPAQLLQVLGDPQAAVAMLGGGKAVTLFEQGYRQIVGVSSALRAYHLFFTDLADESHRPALFHCTTGKDRTGWAAAVILSLFGVSREDVMREYLLTNDQLLPALRPVFDQFKARGGDPDLLLPALGVRKEYLETAFDEMDSRFGSLERYLDERLEIGAETVSSLRGAFIEAAADEAR